MDDLSIASENYAEFDVTMEGSSRTSTAGFEPGSLAEFISRDVHEFNHLVGLTSEGEFDNGMTLQTLSHDVNFFY